jgi:hypothetical protein
MKGSFVLILLVLATISCKHKTYYNEEVNNPEYGENTAFISHEDITLPKFDTLKTKYQLDTIFHGEQDEFKRILLLRNWIRKVIKINDFCSSYPGGDSVEGILDAALKGQGFNCGHYMVVQNAIMNAYGYVTRCLGSGPGVKGGPDGHHGFNEIWINKYNKWFLSDAKYDHHFEKNGVPLSALEVRDEYLKNKAEDIVLVKGPDRTPTDFDGVADKNGKMVSGTRAEVAQWFTWLEWDRSNSRFSVGPGFSSKLNMYQDDYFKNHTWIWDGKPHWAYHTQYVNYVDSRKAIEWTPNTIKGNVIIKGGKAKIKLTSITPNFKEYQMKDSPSGKWVQCDSVTNILLNKKEEVLFFRTLNLANVYGPEFKVVIASR